MRGKGKPGENHFFHYNSLELSRNIFVKKRAFCVVSRVLGAISDACSAFKSVVEGASLRSDCGSVSFAFRSYLFK